MTYVGKELDHVGRNLERLYDFTLVDSTNICHACVDEAVLRRYGSDDNILVRVRKFVIRRPPIALSGPARTAELVPLPVQSR